MTACKNVIQYLFDEISELKVAVGLEKQGLGRWLRLKFVLSENDLVPFKEALLGHTVAIQLLLTVITVYISGKYAITPLPFH